MTTFTEYIEQLEQLEHLNESELVSELSELSQEELNNFAEELLEEIEIDIDETDTETELSDDFDIPEILALLSLTETAIKFTNKDKSRRIAKKTQTQVDRDNKKNKASYQKNKMKRKAAYRKNKKKIQQYRKSYNTAVKKGQHKPTQRKK